MNIFGMLSLVIVIAAAAWFAGTQFEKLQDENSDNNATYQGALDDARNVLGQPQGTDSAEPDTATEVPVPTKTVDPGTGKSIVVYDGISVSEGTTVLNLSDRDLSGSLKAEVRFLSNLKELNLSNNNFNGLPAEVGQLSKLEVLNLSDNPFTGLPQELANLKNLKVLDLRGTQYSKQDLEVIKKGLKAEVQILID
jgi:Leucine-rich repeat (LRR) protein